jgi:nucleoside-diphosphate-sugar epimerase
MAGLVEAGFTGAVNIGTEDTVTVRELVEAICRVAGRTPRLVLDTTRPEGRTIKSADSTLLRRAYPAFRRTIELEAGLRRMLDWHRTEFPRP